MKTPNQAKIITVLGEITIEARENFMSSFLLAYNCCWLIF